MDGSKSRKSDAAATRKRRSSILKSQRSVRAPLSELEFNVATPPDQAKSRRVSFSRRTGVAEFEINEATTAWKNVYEEHNKSLESSANESGVKAAPRRVAHLGGRASHFTDDEAEAVDAREPPPSPSPPPPPLHGELTALTLTHDTVQLFRLDADPARDLTDHLHVDFSAVAPLADDLDALRRDLARETRPANISEYSIDVDFNATHFSLKADDDDMSITDSIRSPAVAAADARPPLDWAADKENIVVNPYVAPKASDNFAVSDDCEDVLVFDGKKCKFQSNLDLSDDGRPSGTVVCDMSVTQAVARVVLPARDEVPQSARGHRTVLLDHDMSVTGPVPAQILPRVHSDDKPSRTVVYDDAAADMSVTQPVARVVLPTRDEGPRSCAAQKTLFFDDDMAVTGAVPAQILQDLDDDSRKPSKTVVYDDSAADMSVTQAVPQVLLPVQDEVTGLDDMAITRALPAEILLSEERHGRDESNATRRKTVVFGNDDGDISVTQAVPSNIIKAGSLGIEQPEQRNTINDNMEDMSVTQALPAEFMQENYRRKTIVFDGDDGHISMTEAVPGSAPLAPDNTPKNVERRKTIVYNNDDGDISVTGVVSTNIHEVAKENPEAIGRRKTIVYNNDDGDISVTGVVSTNIHEVAKENPEAIGRRKTIVYNNDDGDISVTGVVSTNIHEVAKDPVHIGRRKTIEGVPTKRLSPEKCGVSMTEDGNTSLSQPVPSNIINAKSPEIIHPEPQKQKTMYFEDMADMSVTQAVAAEVIQEPRRRKTIVFDPDDGNISMTEAVPASALAPAAFDDKPVLAERRRTIVYNNEDGNISITGVVTTDILAPKLTDPSRSPEQDDSEIYSYIDSARPPVSPLSPATSRNTPNASFDCMSVAESKAKASPTAPGSRRVSILDALLDMSQASVEALAIEYKPQVEPQVTDSDSTIKNTSNTALHNNVPPSGSFKEDQDDGQGRKDAEDITDISKHDYGTEDMPERPAIEGSEPLPLEYKKAKHGIVCKLQHKLSELKDILLVKEKSPKKGHEKSINSSSTTEPEKNSSFNTSIAPPESSMDLENQSVINDLDMKSPSPKHNKTVEREENKTLMINLSSRISTREHDKESTPVEENNTSLATSQQDCEEDSEEPEQREQSQWTGQADDTRAILDALSDLTDTRRPGLSDHKPSSPDKSRRSSAPDRKSMVISREDLLREISMAQAIMQTEMQQTEELTDNSSDEQEPSPPRLSGEVVKTLRFEDDESIIEPRVLQKPAKMKSPPRRASAVIPTYDVSDHVKELVHDLIKPMTDVAPRCLPDFTRAEPSRGSQVDTLESSQIDLIPSSPVLMEPRRASRLRSPEPVAQHSMHVDVSPSQQPAKQEPAVIVFDHLNPLNNVLLPPVDQTVVHKYNPRRSQESLNPSLDSQAVQTEASEAPSRSVDCGMVLVTATVDRAVAIERDVRDTAANTSIVMKGNRELLAASSSLTLVDEALPRSPVRVIFKLDDDGSVQLDSELTSCDSSEHKRQKRGHSASKGPEVTPKPAMKVQKVSSSKAVRRLRSLSPRSSPERSPAASRGSSGTVATVAALWGSDRGEWRPELLHEPSSKNLAAEQDPGVNVVAKIDVLPFMGTSECEWESRAADTWSFRLLHGRLRLLVRLEHRACNTTRAAVRADTPVRLVLVQHARRDTEDDPVAALCLCLAAEALQRVAARGCARAGLVPALLRRGAAVARVARRWGRAVRAARAVLAFSLAGDGLLSLKVANIPLRSVWEVTLRVELCGAGRGVPWPRAADVRVAPVVAAWTPARHELRPLLDAVPEDWGHVPRTVWKIFKYLKNKRPEDELLEA